VPDITGSMTTDLVPLACPTWSHFSLSRPTFSSRRVQGLLKNLTFFSI